jgi:putative PIG3 family NAD(P)H quinone oxidoreductase
MQAIAAAGAGGPDVLSLQTAPTPTPREGEVLVRIAAAGVNRPDIAQREGKYPPPPGAPSTLGLEIAGTIVACGPGSGPWTVGEDVCALVAGGGYAEYCLAPAPQCLPIPHGLSMTEAAALPETFFTVWTNVFQRGKLAAGDTFLVHGGTSGIGTTAIQLAHHFGARVVTTAGAAFFVGACRSLGADLAVNYRTEDFVQAAKKFTDGRGVDLILDMVGGSYLARNIDALAREGRLVQIAFLEDSRVDVDLTPIMVKRLTLTGSTLRPRSIAEKGAIAAELRDHVWPLLASGAVKPIIDRTFPLANAADAHRYMESGKHIGKIVLTV